MSQGSLDFGNSEPVSKPPATSLFFALLPPPEILPELKALALEAMAQGGPAKLLKSDVLHLTLAAILAIDVTDGVLDRAVAAGDAVRAFAVEVVLDRQLAFRGSGANVVASSRPSKALADLYAQLALQLRLRDLKIERGFTPHMTLFYRDEAIAGRDLGLGVRWTAREFVLVESLLGRSQHRIRGRWNLPTPADA